MKYEWFDEYCLNKTGAVKDFKEEWQVTRYMLNGKMFIMHGCNNHGKEIITLKLEPLFGELLRKQYKDIIPGYYMNKEHWNSVFVDGEVPDEVLKDMIDKSYSLIFNSLSKKVQRELFQL